MMRKMSLAELIKKVDWVKIASGRGPYHSLAIKSVTIGFYPSTSSKNKENINQVRIRFGAEVIEQLGWQHKDRICVMHDPEDLMSFLLVKSQNGGSAIYKDTGSTNYRLAFTWNREIPLKKMSGKIVEHHIHEDYIYFRVEEENNNDEQTDMISGYQKL